MINLVSASVHIAVAGRRPVASTHVPVTVAGRFVPHLSVESLMRSRSISFLPEPELYKIARMEQACLEAADGYLSVHGFSEDWQNRRTMARAIGAAIQRASLLLAKLAEGETVPEFPFPNSSVSPGAAVARSRQRAIAFQDLLDGWKAERRPVAKTVYEWSRVIRELEKYLGHTDAHSLTAENLVDWKRALVAAGLRAKTIQGSKLSSVRAILQWGVQNKLLSLNAAEGISLDVKAKQGERKRSFTDDDAKIVLRAALAEQDPIKRWVPWIGAYTGARLSEICQLRREDVLRIEDVWCVKFVPEAGSLKTSGSERIVPVHPALIYELRIEMRWSERIDAQLGVDDKADVDEAGPRDIVEVGEPEDIRPRRLELGLT